MKIDLKKISHNERLSEETNAYSADLWIDGKKIGTVSNAGHGGPDMFHGDQTAYAAADAWCRENLPRWSMGDESHETDLEMHCADLLENHLVSKDLRAALRRSVVFQIPGETILRELRWKGVRQITDQHLAQARKAHPRATILNDLPFDVALGIFRKNG